MNSVMVAQVLWNKFTGQRYCPTDEEIVKSVSKLTRELPAFVGDNAIRRLMGHVITLRSIIAYEPKNEEEAAIKERDLVDLANRSFEEKYLLPENPPMYIP